MGDAATLSVHTELRFSSGVAVAPSFDVRVPPGSVAVVFGPSGAGKTTVLRQIAGLATPSAGTIQLDGEVWCDMAHGVWQSPQARRVGVVFQEPTLFPHLSVRDNISYGLSGSRLDADARKMIDRLGIAHLLVRKPGGLSGGESQRVALARALAPRPRLLLLDEPFASLDGPTRSRLGRELRNLLQATGTPALLVTHDRAEAMAIGDTLVVIVNGIVRQVGPVADVFSHPADAAVAASLGVETVMPARVVGSSDGMLTLAIGQARIEVAEREAIPIQTEVYACIRAEDVTLEAVRASASARNHLTARVVSIVPEGAIERISLDCGFALDAVVTRRSRQELDLAVGKQVIAAIKATSIHIVCR